MKEVDVFDLCRYVDPLQIEQEWAITLASDGKETNGLTIGWAGFGVLWNKPTATVYVHRTRYSKHIFDGADFFSVCFLRPENHKTLEYFGSVSGKDENKIEKCGLQIETADSAPYFPESRVVVLCRVMGKSDFDADAVDEKMRSWYQKDGVHTQYYGEIVKVLVEDETAG